jgi:thymidylate synthase
VERLKVRLPLEKEMKSLMREEKKMEVRMRYGVQMPSWKTRNQIAEDFPRVTGRKLHFYNNKDELMSFWRQNKEVYDFKESEDEREMAFFHNELHHICE